MSKSLAKPRCIPAQDRPRIIALLKFWNLEHFNQPVLTLLSNFPEIEFVTITATTISMPLRGGVAVLCGAPSNAPKGELL